MEQLPVKMLGISNVTAEQIETLCDFATVKPSFVQNRCFAQLGWDSDVRRVCEANGIIYQGFSLLTANVRELASPSIRGIAAAHQVGVAQIVFAFALHVGMVCLTGTTDAQHMTEDLAAREIELSKGEIEIISRC